MRKRSVILTLAAVLVCAFAIPVRTEHHDMCSSCAARRIITTSVFSPQDDVTVPERQCDFSRFVGERRPEHEHHWFRMESYRDGVIPFRMFESCLWGPPVHLVSYSFESDASAEELAAWIALSDALAANTDWDAQESLVDEHRAREY